MTCTPRAAGLSRDAHPACSCPPAATLVASAARGDQRAWEALVARFDPLVRSVARRHRLAAADVDDVAQRTWLALVRHIGRLHDPAAVSSWLATTARHEALRTLEHARRELPTDEPWVATAAEDALDAHHLEAAERRSALAGALERIRPVQRTLLWLLVAEPALSYDQISSALDMPIGSIGPTRARALDRLRDDEELLSALGRPRRRAARARCRPVAAPVAVAA